MVNANVQTNSKLYTFRKKLDSPDRQPVFLLLFLVFWFVINLIQSTFTGLAHDEAYYWMYSKNFAWGYFDHPPVIALLIKIGYSLIPNELGVRLMTSLMGTFTMYIIYSLIDPKNKSLYLFIILVFPIILVHTHIGGFLAIPDLPVLFFTALFFLVYKKYLEKDSFLLSLILGVIIALMLLSKYHGVLVIFFTLIANIKIARRLSFWIIPFIAASLMIPHLLWQIDNGFPTFVYHLFSRSSAYELEHTINFLYSQILIAGPFVGPIVLYLSFAYKTGTAFDRILKINLIGIFAFFFLSSFKGHVEAHWTAIAYIPMLVLSYKALQNSVNAVTWFERLFLPSILLFLIIRILLIFDVVDRNISTLKEIHGWKKWTTEIETLAKGRDVVFINSFQRPAKYSFYSNGKFAHTLNNIYYRKNQYDIWNYEDSLQHKPVLLMQSRNSDDSIITSVGEVYKYKFINDFRSYNNLRITTDTNSIVANPGNLVQVQIEIFNPRDEEIVFHEGEGIVITYHSKSKFQRFIKVYDLKTKAIQPKSSISASISIKMPALKGNYNMYISIITADLYPAMNCRPIPVTIK